MSTPKILFSEAEIAARVETMARTIVSLAKPPEVLVGILAGAFVFAADLARALAREGLPLSVEFLWLRSYGDARSGGDVQVLVGPTDVVRGKRVLLPTACSTAAQHCSRQRTFCSRTAPTRF